VGWEVPCFHDANGFSILETTAVEDLAAPINRSHCSDSACTMRVHTIDVKAILFRDACERRDGARLRVRFVGVEPSAQHRREARKVSSRCVFTNTNVVFTNTNVVFTNTNVVFTNTNVVFRNGLVSKARHVP
jgi:hypothetical protein